MRIEAQIFGLTKQKKAQRSARAALGFLSHLNLPASLAAIEEMFALDRVTPNPFFKISRMLDCCQAKFFMNGLTAKLLLCSIFRRDFICRYARSRAA